MKHLTTGQNLINQTYESREWIYFAIKHNGIQYYVDIYAEDCKNDQWFEFRNGSSTYSPLQIEDLT